MREKVEEFEELVRRHDEFNTYTEMKEVTALHKRNTPITLLTNNESHVLSLEDEVMIK